MNSAGYSNHTPQQQPCGNRLRRLLLVWTMLLVWTTSLHAQTLEISGQLSTWGQVDTDDFDARQLGARYIPELSFSHPLSEDWELSVEAALNIYGFDTFGETGGTGGDFDTDMYRLWGRLASPQLEIRAGLQKISFGPAVLLRPLMWFDSIDPRDPLELTRGVYTLLARYYFLNNANIWVWGLYGNDRPRGWGIFPSSEDDLEYGGRVQVPFRSGEMAFSYHHRTVEAEGSPLEAYSPEKGRFKEDSFGLDGQWDIGIGLWFEASLTRRDIDAPSRRYLRMITLGGDYTFDIGNGLHLLAENLFWDEADEAFGSGDFTSISAMAVNYPLNLFDTLSTILYYDHENDDLSSFVQWQRTYDNWQVYLSVFRTPDRPSSPADREGFTGITGNGVRLMFVYNH